MFLVEIPAGEFMMGSPPEEEGRDDDEGPVHRVRITRPFHIGVYEVTNAEFRLFRPDHTSRDYNDVDLNSDSRPAVLVSREMALQFCDWLSKKEGKKYRLPTEAEWEYACRAGSKGKYPWGESAVDLGRFANVCDRAAKARWNFLEAFNTDDKHAVSSPVGAYPPNAFGVHDMIGNVWEWVQDPYDPDYYQSSPTEDPRGPESTKQFILRGGSWACVPKGARCASRVRCTRGYRDMTTGFRVVREFPR